MNRVSTPYKAPRTAWSTRTPDSEPLVQNIENDPVQLKVLTCYWALCAVML